MRLCSRNLSTMLITRMFSETPGRPGRRQQMPRMTSSIVTPACEAPYSASITDGSTSARSEEHTSELQSQSNLVCRLLLEKKKKQQNNRYLRSTQVENNYNQHDET